MLSEALIKLKKLPDTNRGQQKGNRQAGRIGGQKQYTAKNGFTRRCECKDGSKNWSDARRPTKRKCKTKKKTAPNARLLGCAAQVDVAIQPARQCRAEKSNHRKRKEMNCAKMQKEWITVDERNNSERNKNRAKDNSGLECQLDQHPEQMQTKQKDERAGNRRKCRAVLPQKRTDSAGRSPKGNKNGGKSKHERKCRSKKSAARLLSLAELLHADAGKHGDVSGHERQYARRKKRNQACKKRGRKRNVSMHGRSDLESYGMKQPRIWSQAACACEMPS